MVPYKLPELLEAVAAGRVICIVEGEKKVDRIINELGFAATCNAGGAGKWEHEHSQYLKDADVVLLPDNDQAGHDHIATVAQSLSDIAKRVRVLELPNLPEKGDVVDWQGGAEDFARLIEGATDYVRDPDSGPQPLTRPLPKAEPFPLDAMGPELAPVAQAICDCVQSPIEMCAAGVLASASLAVTIHLDVELPSGKTRPVGDFLWSIGDTGERKSTIDEYTFAAHDQYETKLRLKQAVEREAQRVEHKAWETQSKAIAHAFRKLGEAGSDAHKKALTELGPEPPKPLNSIYMSANFTIEGLHSCLNLGQPFYGIVGSEGGQFVGGHGMADNRKLDTISAISKLWDGLVEKRVRAEEAVCLPGKRSAMHLGIQPKVALIALQDDLLQSQGLLSRILFSYPDSLIGTRFHKEPPPEAKPLLAAYDKRVLEILETPYPLEEDSRNVLEPRPVPFSQEAKKMFWDFHDACERDMAPGGSYFQIKAFVNKLPEHAARLSATIAGYRDLKVSEISHEDLLCGIRLASYYASEAHRLHDISLLNESSSPNNQFQTGQTSNPDLIIAEKLLKWLRDDWGKPTVTARDIYTRGPAPIVNRGIAWRIAAILVDHGHLKELKTARSDSKKWEILK